MVVPLTVFGFQVLGHLCDDPVEKRVFAEAVLLQFCVKIKDICDVGYKHVQARVAEVC